MKVMLLALSALLLASPAWAQAQPLPHPKTGSCSGGYRESGGFCVPKTPDSAPAILKPPGAGCPSGWRASGSTCEKMR